MNTLVDDLWKEYQLGLAVTDKTPEQVFEIVVSPLLAEVKDAFIAGHQAADVHITNDESIVAYEAWKK